MLSSFTPHFTNNNTYYINIINNIKPGQQAKLTNTMCFKRLLITETIEPDRRFIDITIILDRTSSSSHLRSNTQTPRMELISVFLLTVRHHFIYNLFIIIDLFVILIRILWNLLIVNFLAYCPVSLAAFVCNYCHLLMV